MKSSQKGKLQVILGPMFSGKTSELLRRLTRYKLAGYRCLLVVYSKEGDENPTYATHDGELIEAFRVPSLRHVQHLLNNFHVIGIDEAQFFGEIVEFCDGLVEMRKKVVVAGLDGTFQMLPFLDLLSLIPLADNVVKLSAICMSCSREASFTKRIGHETQVELAGGTDKYLAVCQLCHRDPLPTKCSPFKYNNTTTLPSAPRLSFNI